MKKIAMLNCLKSNTVCTGAACLHALEERRKSFEIYTNEEVQLTAFLRCNGCASDPLHDAGMVEKVERLKTIGTEIVHLGICTKKKDGTECPQITAIANMLERQGIAVVRGTH